MARLTDRVRVCCESSIAATIARRQAEAELARLTWMLEEACRRLDGEFSIVDGEALPDLAARYEEEHDDG